MRASVLVLAFAAAFVSAQASITDLPDCALECLTSSNFDGCSLDDQACLCKSQVFITSSTTCIRAGCSAEDDAKAAKITQQLCTQAGVTVAFTTSGGAATATSVASASASSVASASSGSAAATTSAAHSSASAHSTSVAAATSSVAAGASATISQILGSASSAAASATTRPTGAAQANAVGAGAVFMGAVAAVAALAL